MKHATLATGTVALLILYADAVLRVINGLFGDGFGPLLNGFGPLHTFRAPLAATPPPPLPSSSSSAPRPPPPAAVTVVNSRTLPPMYRRTANWTDVDEGIDKCAKHELLLGNLYADFAPWVDLGLRIEERQMAAAINFAEKRRGKWNSWVTDSFTPILIKDGRIYLTLGPPLKDPTNYFWTVLSDLQLLSRTTRLPDAELLLNFADTPIVYAADSGAPTEPGLPIFSYCKRERFLDVLVPGYYTPDRVCKAYREPAGKGANAAYPWHAKRRVAFARYTHFCKPQKQHDEYGRPLPPCARSWFARLARSPQGAARLDVKPLNVVNDTSDPSLAYGQQLLEAGSSLPMAEHGQYAYLLDTDGFTSAYKLQQLLATNSLVLHHRSPWRSYYHPSLAPFVHYVPVWRSSRDDVLRLLDWLDHHDALARRIARNGQHFACEHLTQPGRLCYWQRAIELYASLQAYIPSLARRPRAFPLDALNIMCRIRDQPIVCYYNVRLPTEGAPPGYECAKPIPNERPGRFEECWYKGAQPPAL